MNKLILALAVLSVSLGAAVSDTPKQDCSKEQCCKADKACPEKKDCKPGDKACKEGKDCPKGDAKKCPAHKDPKKA